MKLLCLLSLLVLCSTSTILGDNVVANLDVKSVSVCYYNNGSIMCAVAVTSNFNIGAQAFKGVYFLLSGNDTLSDFSKSVLANLMSANSSGNKITVNTIAETSDISAFLPGINNYPLRRITWLANVSIP